MNSEYRLHCLVLTYSAYDWTCMSIHIEIRTPLVGISGMVGFLITTDLTSEQLDYVHTVQQSAEALLLVINDILDLSKVEAGMMKLEMEPFSIHAMVEGANELLSTLAIQKGLELGFLVEDDVPEIVVGDRVRLRQVLINIIGVSCKQQWFLLMSFLFL